MMKYSLKTGLRNLRESRVILTLIGYNALLYMSMAVFHPYLASYYRSNGLSVSEIGILTAIGPIISLCIQPLWGIMADRTGKHLFFLRAAIIGCIVTVLFFFLGTSFAFFFIAVTLFSLFNTTLAPLSDTINAGQVQKHGYRFSTIRLGGAVGYTITVVSVGGFLTKYPTASFIMMAVCLSLMLLVTFRMEPPVRMAHEKEKKEKLDLSPILKNKAFLFIIFYAFVFQLALGVYSSFIGVYILDLGYTNQTIGWMMCIGAASEIPVLLLIDRFMYRFTTRTMLFFAGFVMVFRILILPISSSIEGVMAAQLLGGLSYMVMYYSTVMFMSNNLSDELRGTGMAILCMVQGGLGSICSNIIGGMMGERLGLNRTYVIYGLFLLLVTLTLILVPLVLKTVKARRKKMEIKITEEPEPEEKEMSQSEV